MGTYNAGQWTVQSIGDQIQEQMFRAIVVDSQRSSRETIARMLETDPEIQLVRICVDGAEARHAIAKEAPDILFVEVQLPDMSGFDLVRSTPGNPAIIFLSTLDRYAAQAFESGAVDYLIKPFLKHRLLKTLDRAKARLKATSDQVSDQRFSSIVGMTRAQSPTRFPERMMVRLGQVQVVQKVLLIDYFTASANYVTVHCRSKSLRMRCTMRDLEKRLDPDRFVRVHRGTIINLESIRDFRPAHRGGYIVTLTDGTELKISRSYSAQFRDALSDNTFPPAQQAG